MRPGSRRLLKLLAGFAIAGLTIWLTFRNTDWDQLGMVFAGAGWGYALAVLPALAASYLFRTLRWMTLLAPVGKVDARTATPPIVIGCMLNSILPGRVGEFARAALLSRKTGIPFASSFATVVVARLFDGLTLTGMALLVMAAMWSALSQAVRGGLIAAGCGYVAVLLVLVALRKWHSRTVGVIVWPLRKAGLAGAAARTEKMLLDFAAGLDILKDPSELFRVAAFSIGLWLSLCASVVPVFLALDIQWTWYYPALVLVLSGLGMMIPTPAGTGTVHYALGVIFPAITGLSEPVAKSMAIFFHATQFLPVIVAGLLFSRGHLRLEEPREP